MEKIADIISKSQNFGIVPEKQNTEIPQKTNIVAKFSGNEYSIRQRDGECYVSVYQDQTATLNQITALLLPFFATYNIQSDARVAYISAVANEKMTVQQLTDSINNVYRTFSQQTFGKPTPGDIVQFDKIDTTKRIFTIDEMFRMATGMARLYYNHELPEVVHNSTEYYNRARYTFFQTIRDNFGRDLTDKKGFKFYVFTDKAARYEKELNWCLNHPNTHLIRYHEIQNNDLTRK